MFPNDRSALRRVYLQAWRRHLDGQPLEPMEQILAEIMRAHPEYHALLEAGESTLERDWTPEMGESNPFLHLSMHAAIVEQVQGDRPSGIRALWLELSRKLGDAHQAEHRMMECLARMLWESQSQGLPPNEQRFMDCLRQLTRG